MLHARRWFTNEIQYADAPCTLLLIRTVSRNRFPANAKQNGDSLSLRSLPKDRAVFHSPSELFDSEICIGINADFAGDAHRFYSQVFGGQLGMLQHRSRGGQSIAAAGPNRHNPVIRLDDIAVAGNNEGSLAVGHDEHSFQVTQGAVLAPIFGQLDGGLLQIA